MTTLPPCFRSGARCCLTLALLPALLLLAACAAKPVPTREGESPQWMSTIRDLHAFPQDLMPFARQAGGNTPLLSATEQAEQDARFNRIFFGPWQMTKATVKRRDAAAILRKARGYKHDDVRWTQAEWDGIARNARMSTYPNTKARAITIRNTDLREMPTHTPRFSEPTPDQRANPFDYFQYSLLPVGTPLFITHTSRDGQWHYIECPVAAGWVDASDVALVDDAFIRAYQTGSYAAIVRDKVMLPGSQCGQVNIGTVLPLADAPTGQPGMINLLVPVRKGRYAATVTTTVPIADAVRKPLPLTPDAVAQIGNVMMGQRYGWGGMFGDRDCSALTRELFTPFGIWLGRNSTGQGRSGLVQPLEGLSPAEKENIILRQGVPFLSLLWMRGHIMLYVGEWKGRPAIFHNVWGVRVINGDDDNDRAVIGRAVVTSITPGAELRNLYRKTTFADRLRSLTTLPPGKR